MKIKVKKAKTLKDQILGLIDPSNPRTMLFTTRFGIHTFFLKNNIDVLILDNQSRVKVIKQSLQPYRLFFYPVYYKTVVELPEGFIDSQKIKLNDKIKLIL